MHDFPSNKQRYALLFHSMYIISLILLCNLLSEVSIKKEKKMRRFSDADHVLVEQYVSFYIILQSGKNSIK